MLRKYQQCIGINTAQWHFAIHMSLQLFLDYDFSIVLHQQPVMLALLKFLGNEKLKENLLNASGNWKKRIELKKYKLW